MAITTNTVASQEFIIDTTYGLAVTLNSICEYAI
jgi:hypothetical protein